MSNKFYYIAPLVVWLFLSCQTTHSPPVPTPSSSQTVNPLPSPSAIAIVTPLPALASVPHMRFSLPIDFDVSRLRVKAVIKKWEMPFNPQQSFEHLFTGRSPSSFVILGSQPRLYKTEKSLLSYQAVDLPNSQSGTFPIIQSHLTGRGNTLYGTAGDCIYKISLPSGKTELLAGQCDEAGYQDGEALTSRFSKILDLAVGQDDSVYVSEFMPLRNGMRLRQIKDKQVSTVFESAPIGTTQKLRGSLLNSFDGLVCEGVCRPGSFQTMPPSQESYDWKYINNGELPAAFYISAYKGNQGEDIPVIRDGKQEIASVWDPRLLKIDRQGNRYLLNRLCHQGYLRRISPSGEVTTLVRDNTTGYPTKHTLNPELSTDSTHCFGNSSYSASTLSFTLDAERNLIYLSSASGLFVLNLTTDQLHRLTPLQEDSPDIIGLEVSEQGQLFAQAFPPQSEWPVPDKSWPNSRSNPGSFLYQIELELAP